MKKFYISGKITGDPNYKEKFAQAEKYLKEKGVIVMNPAVLSEGFSWSEYMHVSYAMIDICDCVFMLRDWESSMGAKAEHTYAIKHKKEVFYQSDFVTPVPTNDLKDVFGNWFVKRFTKQE